MSETGTSPLSEGDDLPTFEPSAFEKKIAELVEKQPEPERHSARTAIHHLKRAWRIKDIDHEMSIFRALTAEEEAAAAVFRSMKRLKYKDAEQLNHRNHVHKNALVPFAHAAGKVLQLLVENGMDPKLVIKDEGPKAGKLQVRLTVKLPNGEEKHAWPIPPLHYGISLNGQPHYFEEQLRELASVGKAKDALAYCKRMANRRNQILYAHPTGIPVAEEPVDAFLEQRRANVFLLLVIYLMIDQHDEHQMFVEQAIGVLLKLLKLVESAEDRPASGGISPSSI